MVESIGAALAKFFSAVKDGISPVDEMAASMARFENQMRVSIQRQFLEAIRAGRPMRLGRIRLSKYVPHQGKQELARRIRQGIQNFHEWRSDVARQAGKLFRRAPGRRALLIERRKPAYERTMAIRKRDWKNRIRKQETLATA